MGPPSKVLLGCRPRPQALPPTEETVQDFCSNTEDRVLPKIPTAYKIAQ